MARGIGDFGSAAPATIVQWRPADARFKDLFTHVIERRDWGPAGLSVEFPSARPLLQVTLGADYAFAGIRGFEPMPPLALWGFNPTRRITRPEGSIHAFVVALTFKGLGLLGAGLARRSTGARLDLLEVMPGPAGRLLEDLRSAAVFAERCSVIETFFEPLKADSGPTGPTEVHRLADSMVSGEIMGSIAEISDLCSVSPRTLLTRFRTELGIAPKLLSRVARVNRAMRGLNPSGWGDGKGDDFRLEFFDDAHLCNEFRSFTGLTPGEFMRRKALVRDPLVYSLATFDRRTGQESPECNRPATR